MYKYICTAAIAVMLSGCYQSVSIHDIDRATKFCSSVDSSVEEIYADYLGSEKVKCINNKSVWINK